MIVTCPHCSAESRVVDTDVPASGAKMQCAKCTSLFFVRPPAKEDAQKIVRTQRVERPPKAKKERSQKTQRVGRPAKKPASVPDPKRADMRPPMKLGDSAATTPAPAAIPPKAEASFVGPSTVVEQIEAKRKKTSKAGPEMTASFPGSMSMVAMIFAGIYFVFALFIALWSVGLPVDSIAMPIAEALGARPPRSSTGRDVRTAPEIETRATGSAARGDLLSAAVQWRRADAKAPNPTRRAELNAVLRRVGRRQAE